MRDKRFNTILHQGLGKVTESLAKRLLIAEGFDVKDFSFSVSPYIAGVRYGGGMSQLRRLELWEELLEEQGPLFADPRVRDFVDDLVGYKMSRKDGANLGGLVDLIAKKRRRTIACRGKIVALAVGTGAGEGVGACAEAWSQDDDPPGEVQRQV